MKIFGISQEHLDLAEANTVNMLLNSGLDCFHLRKPTADEKFMRNYIVSLDSSARRKTVLCSHYHLIDEFGLAGGHVREQDWGNTSSSWSGTVSTSVHDVAYLDNLLPSPSYAFLGPVFSSISKVGYEPKYPLDVLNATVANSPIPMIAIGGISARNVSTLSHTAWSGVALLGALWRNDSNSALKEFESVKSLLGRSSDWEASTV